MTTTLSSAPMKCSGVEAMISATVLADSLAPCGKRLTTLVVRMHRFILPEFNTHRSFSRSAASSRAIPVWKTLRRVLREPAFPVNWGRNQKGMSAKNELSTPKRKLAKLVWRGASVAAVASAWLLSKIGLHKQVANRLLEPFLWVDVVVTATEWENFFGLRLAENAQPEIKALAEKMLAAMRASTPKQLAVGQWHLPFADKHTDADADATRKIMISVARCARVSYSSHDGSFSFDADARLFWDLLASGHMGPMEHQADALEEPTHSGNLVGFHQFRKSVGYEQRTFDIGASS